MLFWMALAGPPWIGGCPWDMGQLHGATGLVSWRLPRWGGPWGAGCNAFLDDRQLPGGPPIDCIGYSGAVVARPEGAFNGPAGERARQRS
ncbi:hypothetical protein NDU88_004422 [Pleurodeles waltl]|uniref:Uncharacterized protein n=1 Tax=Pleurodeles waltl TaxID=8319 RepID=A0AAV7SIQ9_PLEWA|nr:hypothetical protein NDU88_004422 [Pleurodeles waltl]